jgi:hypothetical protein
VPGISPRRIEAEKAQRRSALCPFTDDHCEQGLSGAGIDQRIANARWHRILIWA